MSVRTKSKPRVLHEISWSVFHALADFEMETSTFCAAGTAPSTRRRTLADFSSIRRYRDL